VGAEAGLLGATTPRSPSCDADHAGRSYMLERTSGYLVRPVHEIMLCTNRLMAAILGQARDRKKARIEKDFQY
jgi:hypothetical protein